MIVMWIMQDVNTGTREVMAGRAGARLCMKGGQGWDASSTWCTPALPGVIFEHQTNRLSTARCRSWYPSPNNNNRPEQKSFCLWKWKSGPESRVQRVGTYLANLDLIPNAPYGPLSQGWLPGWFLSAEAGVTPEHHPVWPKQKKQTKKITWKSEILKTRWWWVIEPGRKRVCWLSSLSISPFLG